MKIKITASNKEQLDALVEGIMNTVTVVFGRGRIPNEKDIKIQERGLYWRRNDEKFFILEASGNHFAFIVSESDTQITLAFYSRYSDAEIVAITSLINTFWKEQTEIIQ